MDDDLSVLGVVGHFADFNRCQQLVMKLRWADGKVRCPQCGSENVTYLEKTRVWKCYGDHARAKFSLKTGTIFEDSPISLVKWIPTAWLVINFGKRVSSYDVHRAMGVTQKTAWSMMDRIRLAMLGRSLKNPGGGVTVDAPHFHSRERCAEGTDCVPVGKPSGRCKASVTGGPARAGKAPAGTLTIKPAAEAFETTPEFRHFLETMFDVLAVSSRTG
jgi:transposase-like protein